jgi:hypothetical protein
MAVLRQGGRQSGAALLAGLSGLLLAWALPAEARDGTLEIAVKANYLYKFAPFVDWPTAAFAGPAAPVTICLGGEDPFGQALDDAVRGQMLGGRRILVRRLASPATAGGCSILFVGRTRNAADFFRAVAGRPVLTVADQDRGPAGAMIQFMLKDGRVRFSIDADAATASGLTISSKLLGLAVSVKRTAR